MAVRALSSDPQEASMEIKIQERDAVSVAVISGEIDGKTAPQAQAELIPVITSSGKIILDLSAVSFLSSAGLRMLLLLYRQATAKDGKVVLVGLSEEIKDTMSMTGFLKFFVVTDSLDEGVRALD